MKTTNSLIVLLLSLCLCVSLFSYSIPNHRELSNLSGELLQACGLKTELDLEAVSKYSAKEDSSPHRGSLKTRLVHWHFYNNESEADVWFLPGLVKKTFHSRWRDLEVALLNPVSLQDKSRTVGALAHFIQDVTNPSHVVPVYHGPGQKDLFDYYPVQKVQIRQSFSAQCALLNSIIDTHSVSGLLHKAAQKTLKSLEENIQFSRNGIQESAKLGEAFWVKSSTSKKFFGKYGFLENNFGITSFKMDFYIALRGPRATEERHKYQVKLDASEYKSYALKQQTRAVVYGAALIGMANRVQD